ncbi:hypothetical protein [Lewinella sp. W8]|uniref:hypothetical protein n=1 Tax=Lewinella sp. W8 TaxID=2528208 RepID=UPI0010677AAD|nr:hypothetical protein [Lewinella sp. W8]MTB51187.1 hypothetical protein [Lewinella sp. W8]
MPNQDGLAFIPNQRQQQKIHAAFRILLSSYSRYYNTKYDKRGSLIRAKTKYKPGYSDFIPKNEDLTEDTPFTRFVPYLKVCFRYIHQNPVTAGYALTPKAWRFGSAPDYASIRDEQICNYALSEKLLGIKRL